MEIYFCPECLSDPYATFWLVLLIKCRYDGLINAIFVMFLFNWTFFRSWTVCIRLRDGWIIGASSYASCPTSVADEKRQWLRKLFAEVISIISHMDICLHLYGIYWTVLYKWEKLLLFILFVLEVQSALQDFC